MTLRRVVLGSGWSGFVTRDNLGRSALEKANFGGSCGSVGPADSGGVEVMVLGKASSIVVGEAVLALRGVCGKVSMRGVCMS